MLDVHPPDHAIHGKRDFFIHLLTITVGLLIALGLEAGVEALHHRGERREAEAALREEITHNRDTLTRMQKETDRERNDLINVLGYLKDLREGKPGDANVLNFTFNVDPLDSAAWQTASTTGALSYIDGAKLQRYSEAYQSQHVLEAAIAAAFSHEDVLETYGARGKDPREMKPKDIESAIHDARQVLADVLTMSDYARGALASYDKALRE